MLQVYHDPASTVPPQMADRIDALRAALQAIAKTANLSVYEARIRLESIAARAEIALATDDRAEDDQDAAQMAAYDERTAEALESLQFMPDAESDTCGYCGEPCILDPHFACAMEQAQRG